MDSINPQDTQSELQKAIEQIKQWQKEGKKEDAIQGCKEIIEIAPDNMEIKMIMQSLQTPTPAPQPAPTPIPTPVVLPKPVVTPQVVPEEFRPAKQLDNIAQGNANASHALYDITAPENPLYSALNETAKPEKIIKKETSHGIVLNLLVIVGTILILGGGAYAYLKFFAQSEDVETIELPKEDIVITTDTEVTDVVVEDEVEETTTTLDTEVNARNEQRFADLTEIETVIKSYYEENGKYPDAMELSSFVSKYDPMDGETDTTGQVFVYSYAVYNTTLGSNQEYILSGLFEDENGENTVWTTGADPQNHPDYRNGTAENFILITAGPATTDTEETKVKVKVKK